VFSAVIDVPPADGIHAGLDIDVDHRVVPAGPRPQHLGSVGRRRVEAPAAVVGHLPVVEAWRDPVGRARPQRVVGRALILDGIEKRHPIG
jgi:hypothetical protein